MKRSSRNASMTPRFGGIVIGLLVCLVLAGVTGWVGYAFFVEDEKNVSIDDLITEKVTRGPFDHVVLESGEIESSSNVELVCEVESRGAAGTQILWVIDEGARVKKGDKLVELDSSQLDTELKEDRLQVLAAESNVTTAEAAVKQAEIAREEYLKGVFMTEKKAIESRIAVAEQDLRKAQLALQSSERLLAKGLIKDLQLEADRFAVVNATNVLASAKQELEVLQELTREKFLVQYDSDIDAAKATLSAMQSELVEEQAEMEEREQQIENCIIFAPTDGVVVHANRYSRRGGNAEFVVEPGAVVREQQAIIRLPDPTQMQVKCNINESQISMIESGMPAKISIEPLPELKLRGVVQKVNRYPEPGSWMSSSVKEFGVTVKIIDPPTVIRTGMTAAVRIFVQQLPNALQIPIQGLYEHGGEMYTLVHKGGQNFETRKIDVGATNDTMASIESGVEEGETIVLNLRQHLALMDLPELEAEDNSDLSDIGEEEAERERRGPAGERDTSRGPEGRPSADGPSRQGGPQQQGRPDGGTPSPAAVSQRIIEANDTDGDGSVSSDEISAAQGRAKTMLQSADSDGDGSVSKSELQSTVQKRLGGGGRP